MNSSNSISPVNTLFIEFNWLKDWLYEIVKESNLLAFKIACFLIKLDAYPGINSFSEVYDTINKVLVIKNESKKVEIMSKLRIDNLKKNCSS